MRIPIKVLALAIVAFASLASQASATSLIRLDYLGGSTAQAGSGGSSIQANASDQLSFDVNVDVDAGGIATLSFDILWFDDASMDLMGTTWETGTKFTSFTPTTFLDLGSPTTPSVTGGTGIISGVGWGHPPIGPYPTSTSVFLGTIVFHVQNSSHSIVQAGFFHPTFSRARDASLAFVTPNFTVFAVNPAPELGVSALMGLGLLGLALAATLRRRD